MEKSYGNEGTGAVAGAEVRKERSGKRDCAGFGLLLIVMGLLWLVAHAGWVPAGVFCPLTLILIGLWISLPSRWLGRRGNS